MTPDAPSARERDPRLRLLVGMFAVLVAMTQVGSIIAPSLVKRSPELLIALSSRIRHLLFAVPAGINPIAYSVIGMARLTAAAVLCYLLGRDYGERGMAWLERQLGGETPATFRWLQLGVERAAPLLVFLMPGSNIVCVLVGLRRIPSRRFAAALVTGIAFRLAWVWVAAKRFERQLTSALDWITAHQWWLVAAFMGLSVVQSMVKAARQQRPPGAQRGG